jgi:hypothetical protein
MGESVEGKPMNDEAKDRDEGMVTCPFCKGTGCDKCKGKGKMKFVMASPGKGDFLEALKESTDDDIDNPKFTHVNLHFAHAERRKDDKHKVEDAEHAFVDISWAAKGVGFGHLTIYQRDGKLMMRTEAMSREFAEKVVLELVRRAQIVE